MEWMRTWATILNALRMLLFFPLFSFNFSLVFLCALPSSFSSSSLSSLLLLALPCSSFPPLACSPSFSFLLQKNLPTASKERPSSWPPRSSNRLQLFANSLDMCRPMVGHQKHHSGAPTTNQRLTRGHPKNHTCKKWLHKNKPRMGVYTVALIQK